MAQFKINDTLKRIKPFIVMEMLEEAQKLEALGHHVIHFEVGEPDFDLPDLAAKGLTHALDIKQTHYTHSLGLLELRKAIALNYLREYGVEVDYEQIMVTSGSSAAILMAVMLLCNEGDEVIISDPGYACYANFLLACKAVPVPVRVFANNNFQYNIDDIKRAITPKTKAIIVNSPMNPTGAVIDQELFKELARLDIPIISDEIYHGLVYDSSAQTALKYISDAIVINGFSKRYAMTGLRLGWMVAPRNLMRHLQTLQQNLFICAPSVSQLAAVEVLNGSSAQITEMVEEYNKRRNFMVLRLREMGVKIATEPKGAFYIFCDISEFSDNSYEFCKEILREIHVACTPGIDFGSYGEGYIRFSYATSLEDIAEGMRRLEKYLNKLRFPKQ